MISQVASLQAELAMVQTQLINSRFAIANALQHQQQQQQHIAYSNNSSASTNLVNLSNFTSNFDLTAETAPSSHSLEPIQLSRPSTHDEDGDEEESHKTIIFANQILRRQ